jgi:hypothetical protein
MNYTEHKFTLDIHSTVSRVSLCVKKGDTARRLQIHFAERGYPYPISDGCYAVFTAKKPDGKVLYNNCSISGSVIIYDFTEQTVTVAGRMECEIILYGADGKQLTSAGFGIFVDDTVYDSETEIESTSEYNALADLVAKVLGGSGTGGGGFSPIAKVTQTEEGATIEITDKNGTTTATVTNGKDGVDGKDGQDGAPGKDYVLTEADKEEIAGMVPSGEVPPTDELVQAVIDALPVYDGSYTELEFYDGSYTKGAVK